MNRPIKRNRPGYFLLTLGSISLGLLSRSTLIPLPMFVVTYAGDTLWAFTVFLILCLLFPRRPTIYLAIVALGFSFVIEFSQFYHAPWINGIRQNFIGGLILGFGFKASDLLCYTTGVLLGVVIDKKLIQQKRLFKD